MSPDAPRSETRGATHETASRGGPRRTSGREGAAHTVAPPRRPWSAPVTDAALCPRHLTSGAVYANPRSPEMALPRVPDLITRPTMSCHYQLERSPAPSSPRHENRDDSRPLCAGPSAARTGAHEERSRIRGIGALSRRRDDGHPQPDRRAGGIRRIFEVVLWHKHFYEYTRDTSRQLRALVPRASKAALTRRAWGTTAAASGDAVPLRQTRACQQPEFSTNRRGASVAPNDVSSTTSK